MKLVIVANHNGQRVVRWQGVLCLTLLYLALAGTVFFGGYYAVARRFPPAIGIAMFFVVPLFIFVGTAIRRALSKPLEHLPMI